MRTGGLSAAGGAEAVVDGAEHVADHRAENNMAITSFLLKFSAYPELRSLY